MTDADLAAATSRADALAVENRALRDALHKHAVRLVGPFLRCDVCRGERILSPTERETAKLLDGYPHQDSCLLAAKPDERGARLLAAADKLNDTLSIAVCDFLSAPGMTAQEFVAKHMTALIKAGDTAGCYGHLRAQARVP